ncbi:TEX15 [Branchiostoma lanceolatum]|uniref:TEX15 protein n=1 Tax=Branchiostoma lanceolatum TaxID=7740 RepID=A0A8K0ED68_BRALA|nr:TEX15 [Branchiostoma lanceolatum]
MEGYRVPRCPPGDYCIPKVKRTGTDGPLTPVRPGSREELDILKIVKRSFLNENFSSQYGVKKISLVNNAELERDFSSKRQEMKEHGRDVTEKYLFSTSGGTEAFIKGKTAVPSQGRSVLGDSTKGVYLKKNADVCLRCQVAYHRTKTRLLIYKVMLGRVLAVAPNSRPDPDPNHDCHVSRQPPRLTDKYWDQYLKTQVYLYEYNDEGLPVKRPRQVLPYAAVTLVDTTSTDEEQSDQPTVHRVVEGFPMLEPVSVTLDHRKPVEPLCPKSTTCVPSPFSSVIRKTQCEVWRKKVAVLKGKHTPTAAVTHPKQVGTEDKIHSRSVIETETKHKKTATPPKQNGTQDNIHSISIIDSATDHKESVTPPKDKSTQNKVQSIAGTFATNHKKTVCLTSVKGKKNSSSETKKHLFAKPDRKILVKKKKKKGKATLATKESMSVSTHTKDVTSGCGKPAEQSNVASETAVNIMDRVKDPKLARRRKPVDFIYNEYQSSSVVSPKPLSWEKKKRNNRNNRQKEELFLSSPSGVDEIEIRSAVVVLEHLDHQTIVSDKLPPSYASGRRESTSSESSGLLEEFLTLDIWTEEDCIRTTSLAPEANPRASKSDDISEDREEESETPMVQSLDVQVSDPVQRNFLTFAAEPNSSHDGEVSRPSPVMSEALGSTSSDTSQDREQESETQTVISLNVQVPEPVQRNFLTTAAESNSIHYGDDEASVPSPGLSEALGSTSLDTSQDREQESETQTVIYLDLQVPEPVQRNFLTMVAEPISMHSGKVSAPSPGVSEALGSTSSDTSQDREQESETQTLSVNVQVPDLVHNTAAESNSSYGGEDGALSPCASQASGCTADDKLPSEDEESEVDNDSVLDHGLEVIEGLGRSLDLMDFHSLNEEDSISDSTEHEIESIPQQEDGMQEEPHDKEDNNCDICAEEAVYADKDHVAEQDGMDDCITTCQATIKEERDTWSCRFEAQVDTENKDVMLSKDCDFTSRERMDLTMQVEQAWGDPSVPDSPSSELSDIDIFSLDAELPEHLVDELNFFEETEESDEQVALDYTIPSTSEDAHGDLNGDEPREGAEELGLKVDGRGVESEVATVLNCDQATTDSRQLSMGEKDELPLSQDANSSVADSQSVAEDSVERHVNTELKAEEIVSVKKEPVESYMDSKVLKLKEDEKQLKLKLQQLRDERKRYEAETGNAKSAAEDFSNHQSSPYDPQDCESEYHVSSSDQGTEMIVMGTNAVESGQQGEKKRDKIISTECVKEEREEDLIEAKQLPFSEPADSPVCISTSSRDSVSSDQCAVDQENVTVSEPKGEPKTNGVQETLNSCENKNEEKVSNELHYEDDTSSSNTGKDHNLNIVTKVASGDNVITTLQCSALKEKLSLTDRLRQLRCTELSLSLDTMQSPDEFSSTVQRDSPPLQPAIASSSSKDERRINTTSSSKGEVKVYTLADTYQVPTNKMLTKMGLEKLDREVSKQQWKEKRESWKLEAKSIGQAPFNSRQMDQSAIDHQIDDSVKSCQIKKQDGKAGNNGEPCSRDKLASDSSSMGSVLLQDAVVQRQWDNWRRQNKKKSKRWKDSKKLQRKLKHQSRSAHSFTCKSKTWKKRYPNSSSGEKKSKPREDRQEMLVREGDKMQCPPQKRKADVSSEGLGNKPKRRRREMKSFPTKREKVASTNVNAEARKTEVRVKNKKDCSTDSRAQNSKEHKTGMATKPEGRSSVCKVQSCRSSVPSSQPMPTTEVTNDEKSQKKTLQVKDSHFQPTFSAQAELSADKLSQEGTEEVKTGSSVILEQLYRDMQVKLKDVTTAAERERLLLAMKVLQESGGTEIKDISSGNGLQDIRETDEIEPSKEAVELQQPLCKGDSHGPYTNDLSKEETSAQSREMVQTDSCQSLDKDLPDQGTASSELDGKDDCYPIHMDTSAEENIGKPLLDDYDSVDMDISEDSTNPHLLDNFMLVDMDTSIEETKPHQQDNIEGAKEPESLESLQEQQDAPYSPTWNGFFEDSCDFQINQTESFLDMPPEFVRVSKPHAVSSNLSISEKVLLQDVLEVLGAETPLVEVEGIETPLELIQDEETPLSDTRRVETTQVETQSDDYHRQEGTQPIGRKGDDLSESEKAADRKTPPIDETASFLIQPPDFLKESISDPHLSIKALLSPPQDRNVSVPQPAMLGRDGHLMTLSSKIPSPGSSPHSHVEPLTNECQLASGMEKKTQNSPMFHEHKLLRPKRLPSGDVYVNPIEIPLECIEGNPEDPRTKPNSIKTFELEVLHWKSHPSPAKRRRRESAPQTRPGSTTLSSPKTGFPSHSPVSDDTGEATPLLVQTVGQQLLKSLQNSLRSHSGEASKPNHQEHRSRNVSQISRDPRIRKRRQSEPNNTKGSCSGEESLVEVRRQILKDLRDQVSKLNKRGTLVESDSEGREQPAAETMHHGIQQTGSLSPFSSTKSVSEEVNTTSKKRDQHADSDMKEGAIVSKEEAKGSNLLRKKMKRKTAPGKDISSKKQKYDHPKLCAADLLTSSQTSSGDLEVRGLPSKPRHCSSPKPVKSSDKTSSLARKSTSVVVKQRTKQERKEMGRDQMNHKDCHTRQHTNPKHGHVRKSTDGKKSCGKRETPGDEQEGSGTLKMSARRQQNMKLDNRVVTDELCLSEDKHSGVETQSPVKSTCQAPEMPSLAGLPEVSDVVLDCQVQSCDCDTLSSVEGNLPSILTTHIGEDCSEEPETLVEEQEERKAYEELLNNEHGTIAPIDAGNAFQEDSMLVDAHPGQNENVQQQGENAISLSLANPLEIDSHLASMNPDCTSLNLKNYPLLTTKEKEGKCLNQKETLVYYQKRLRDLGEQRNTLSSIAPSIDPGSLKDSLVSLEREMLEAKVCIYSMRCLDIFQRRRSGICRWLSKRDSSVQNEILLLKQKIKKIKVSPQDPVIEMMERKLEHLYDQRTEMLMSWFREKLFGIESLSARGLRNTLNHLLTIWHNWEEKDINQLMMIHLEKVIKKAKIALKLKQVDTVNLTPDTPCQDKSCDPEQELSIQAEVALEANGADQNEINPSSCIGHSRKDTVTMDCIMTGTLCRDKQENTSSSEDCIPSKFQAIDGQRPSCCIPSRLAGLEIQEPSAISEDSAPIDSIPMTPGTPVLDEPEEPVTWDGKFYAVILPTQPEATEEPQAEVTSTQSEIVSSDSKSSKPEGCGADADLTVPAPPLEATGSQGTPSVSNHQEEQLETGEETSTAASDVNTTNESSSSTEETKEGGRRQDVLDSSVLSEDRKTNDAGTSEKCFKDKRCDRRRRRRERMEVQRNYQGNQSNNRLNCNQVDGCYNQANNMLSRQGNSMCNQQNGNTYQSCFNNRLHCNQAYGRMNQANMLCRQGNSMCNQQNGNGRTWARAGSTHQQYSNQPMFNNCATRFNARQTTMGNIPSLLNMRRLDNNMHCDGDPTLFEYLNNIADRMNPRLRMSQCNSSQRWNMGQSNCQQGYNCHRY